MPQPKLPDKMELGQTGLKRSGGIVQEEYLRELQGPRWHKTVRAMIDDPVIAAVLLLVEMLLRQVGYRVEPASNDKEHADDAEFIDGALDDMSFTWEDTLTEILSALPYGWSYFEIVYKQRNGDVTAKRETPDMAESKYNDGRIGWRKWSIRGQETLSEWDFDDTGGIRGMWQIAPPKYQRVYIPIEKALLFRTTSRKNNPEGRSMLRGAYNSYYLKRNIQIYEAIGIERDLCGVPMAHIPAKYMSANATTDEKAIYEAYKDIVRNLRADEQAGVVVPSDRDANGNPLFEITLMGTNARRLIDTDKVISRHNRDIGIALLADIVLIGHETTGSFALSKSKASMLTTSLNATLTNLFAPINRFAIPDLLRLNGRGATGMPEICHLGVDSEDVQVLVDAAKTLTEAGMGLFPDYNLEQFFRKRLGWPEETEEDYKQRQAMKAEKEDTEDDMSDSMETENGANGKAKEQVM